MLHSDASQASPRHLDTPEDDGGAILSGFYGDAERAFGHVEDHRPRVAAMHRIATQLQTHKYLVMAIVALVMFWVAMLIVSLREVPREVDARSQITPAAAAREPVTAPMPPPVREVAAKEQKPVPTVATEKPVDAERQVPSPAASPKVATPSPRSAAAVDGQLVVSTEPAGARVTVNSINWGVTPVTIGHLPFGAKQIRVTLDGYASAQRTVHVGEDQPRRKVHIRLRN